MHPHRVVILGGGFGGLYAAKSLNHPEVEVTLVDQRNFHLFQPLLYQVATGGLSPADIAAPLRSILKHQRNTRVVHQRAVDLDVSEQKLILEHGEVQFDTLIVATGVRHQYFGNDDWERFAPGLKTVEDATSIRSKVLAAFEQAEKSGDPDAVRRHLSFAIIGGGPTGVELAGAIGELAHHTLRGEFRRIDTGSARITLLEGAERILLAYPERLADHATRSLAALGVEVSTGSLVTGIDSGGLSFKDASGEHRLEAGCILWAAGVTASDMGRVLEERAGAEVDRVGRVSVTPTLNVPGHPNLYVIGDLAALNDPQTERSLPGVAPVAMQQGAYVARALRERLLGRAPAPFRYRDRGSLAVIGRARAVARIFGVNVHGYPAWLVWLFVHVLYLVEYESRLIVLIQWAWSYLTRNRRARLITGDPEPVNDSLDGRRNKGPGQGSRPDPFNKEASE